MSQDGLFGCECAVVVNCKAPGRVPAEIRHLRAFKRFFFQDSRCRRTASTLARDALLLMRQRRAIPKAAGPLWKRPHQQWSRDEMIRACQGRYHQELRPLVPARGAGIYQDMTPPPSMLMACPLMPLLLSRARKTAIAATSSGSMRRF
jgi:hypothetical protein